MDKPYVSFKEEPLKWLCNEAFHLVKGRLPERIRETNDYNNRLAFILGYGVGGFGGATLCQFVIHPTVVDPLLKFAKLNWVTLDHLVVGGLLMVAGTELQQRVIARQKGKEWARENPEYFIEANGVKLGASTYALIYLYWDKITPIAEKVYNMF